MWVDKAVGCNDWTDTPRLCTDWSPAKVSSLATFDTSPCSCPMPSRKASCLLTLLVVYYCLFIALFQAASRLARDQNGDGLFTFLLLLLGVNIFLNFVSVCGIVHW